MCYIPHEFEGESKNIKKTHKFPKCHLVDIFTIMIFLIVTKNSKKNLFTVHPRSQGFLNGILCEGTMINPHKKCNILVFPVI